MTSSSTPFPDNHRHPSRSRFAGSSRRLTNLQGLVLGTTSTRGQSGFGFSARGRDDLPADADILRHNEPSHGIVFSRTGGGKLLSTIVPNVLAHNGPCYVFDPKGEIAAVTARHRRTLGEVIVIDPFQVNGPDTGSLNPIDLLQLAGMNPEDCAETLAWEMSSGHESAKDPFWQNTSTSLLAGLCASVALDPDPTLVAIDETANLGRLDQLSLMHTFLRGAGVSLLTAFQSLGQLSDIYPSEWRTIVENCGVIQAFSLHPTAVEPLASLFGVSPGVLRSMEANEQLVARADRPPEVMGRIDYRTHPAFRELADSNPRYTNRQNDVS